MSSLSDTILSLRKESKAKCQAVYHQMFRKVKAQLEHEVMINERKGRHSTLLRLPNVPNSFTLHTNSHLPPQAEIDRYIISQLEKRGLIVVSSSDRLIHVDWSGIYKQDVALTSRVNTAPKTVRAQEKQNKEKIEKSISLSPPTMTASLPPPPMNSNGSKKPSHVKKKKSCQKQEAMSIQPKRCVLSNKVSELDSATEQKMAAAHQALLRSLAGV